MKIEFTEEEILDAWKEIYENAGPAISATSIVVIREIIYMALKYNKQQKNG